MFNSPAWHLIFPVILILATFPVAETLVFRMQDESPVRAGAGETGPIPEARFKWKALEKGLAYATFTLERPDTTHARLHVLRFNSDRFGFKVMGAPGPGFRVEDLLTPEKCAAGINGSYFYFKDTLGTRMPLGLTTIGGRTVAPWKRNYSGSFSATRGRAAIHYRVKPPPGAESVLQSFPMLLSGGRLADALRDTLSGKINLRNRHRRSAVGFDGRDRVYFILSVHGLTFPELARSALAMGVVDALSMDGGGSSQMAVFSRDTLLFPGYDRVPVSIGAFRR